jgi:hypothetical protein
LLLVLTPCAHPRVGLGSLPSLLLLLPPPPCQLNNAPPRVNADSRDDVLRQYQGAWCVAYSFLPHFYSHSSCQWEVASYLFELTISPQSSTLP